MSRREIAAIGLLAGATMALTLGVALARSPSSAGSAARATACPGWRRPAIASDPRPDALRVFAIQFDQQPAHMQTAADYSHAIDCAIKTEVLPHLAHGRPNLVVFDEDVGLETITIGPRGALARALIHNGVPSCKGQQFPCETLAALTAIDAGYGRALGYLEPRYPGLASELGRSFVAATDEFVRVFMTTMAGVARRYGLYVIASNTQPPFRLTRNSAAVEALRDPATPSVKSVYEPTADVAYDQTFVWGPRIVHRDAPPPLANLLADNDKVPLTSFEQELGFASGPARGAAARRNLRPVSIPGTAARLGIATSLPAFEFGHAAPGRACADVAKTYVRCLSHLGANVLIQADANDGQWTGTDQTEQWQPLSWMGSAYRAVSDPSVRFTYAVNAFMVGNLADTPFDGQSAILQRGRRGNGCHYIGNRAFIPGEDLPVYRSYAGAKSQFLALAPWVVPDAARNRLRPIGAALASGSGGYRYVQTAVIADLPFPADARRPGCVVAGR